MLRRRRDKKNWRSSSRTYKKVRSKSKRILSSKSNACKKLTRSSKIARKRSKS